MPATPQATQHSLTVCIPCCNDAQRLDKCLEALEIFSGCITIVVIDSAFDSNSENIAINHGAVYETFQWNGGYPKKRNWFLLGLSQYHSRWSLFLDTDELVTKDFAHEVLAIIGSNYDDAFDVYQGTYANYFLGKRLRFGIPFRKSCLCKTGFALYERIDESEWSSLDMEVHEHLVPLRAAPFGKIKSPIIHQENKTQYDRIARHNEYSSWESRKILQLSQSIPCNNIRAIAKKHILAGVFAGPTYFFLNYLLFLGFLDGRAGLLFSLFKLSYFNDIAIKVMEKRSINSYE